MEYDKQLCSESKASQRSFCEGLLDSFVLAVLYSSLSKSNTSNNLYLKSLHRYHTAPTSPPPLPSFPRPTMPLLSNSTRSRQLPLSFPKFLHHRRPLTYPCSQFILEELGVRVFGSLLWEKEELCILYKTLLVGVSFLKRGRRK